MKNVIKSEGGFTLVELLGVVAIIAVLATVAITSINGAIAAGRESSARRQAQVLNSAYQSYLAAGGTAQATAALAIAQMRNQINAGAGPIGPFLTADVPVAGLINFSGSGRNIGFDSQNGFNIQ